MKAIRYARSGFTLVEVLTASTITVLITLVAVSALKAVSDTSQTIQKTTQTTSEVRFAAQMLARDLANFYRDVNARNMLLVGVSQEADSVEPPSLRFYTVGRMKARVDQPEGDVYEVEYILGEPRAVSARPTSAESSKRTLYRRLWPNPDREEKELRGILSPIADNLDVFQIRFYDGKQWVNQWTEDMRQLPLLIEVTLAVIPDGRGEPTAESFIVSFPRLASGTSGDSTGQSSPEQPNQPQQGSSEGSGQSGQAENPGGR